MHEDNESVSFSDHNEKRDLEDDGGDYRNGSQSFVEDVEDEEPSEVEKPKFKMMNFAGINEMIFVLYGE